MSTPILLHHLENRMKFRGDYEALERCINAAIAANQKSISILNFRGLLRRSRRNKALKALSVQLKAIWTSWFESLYKCRQNARIISRALGLVDVDKLFKIYCDLDFTLTMRDESIAPEFVDPSDAEMYRLAFGLNDAFRGAQHRLRELEENFHKVSAK